MREKYTFAVLRLQDLGQFVAAVYGGDLHPALLLYQTLLHLLMLALIEVNG